MITALVLLTVVVAAFVTLRRSGRRRGVTVPRSFVVEPPAGRIGVRRGERL